MYPYSQPETGDLVKHAWSPDQRARHVLISVNPRAGARWRQNHTLAIRDALASSGFHVRVLSDLDELAAVSEQQSLTGQLRAVVAIGGDGTASAVRSRVPLEVPLVPVPMGTENLLGRFVTQRTDAAAVCRTLETGVVVGLDLGRAGDKHFLLMISAGFDAEVVRDLHENRRGNINRLAYVWPALRALRNYSFPELRVTTGKDLPSTETHVGRWLFGFNLPLYALGLRIAPQAQANDGKFDVCLFRRGGYPSALRYLWYIETKRHTKLADATIVQSSRFRIECAGPVPVAYQTDGDYGGTLPVDVDVLPGELRLLVSRDTAMRLGFSCR